jgi:peptidoglycan/xylan/chitin deacetylase (PgdA/CDA1 family)
VTESAGADNAPAVSRRRRQLPWAVRRRVRAVLLRAAARQRAAPGIRVLAYHLLPSPPQFRAHVEAIREVAEIIDEDTFLDALENPDTLAANGCRVLLTFDDGYRQHLIGEALDLVRDLGLRPTVFMLAAGVDPTLGPPQRLFRGQSDHAKPLVDATELRTAVAAGWFVGSHTSTHWDCSRDGAGDLAREIGGSKAILEDCIGSEVRTFAFPWGKPENISPNAYDAVRTSGYRAAFTTVRGRIAHRPPSEVDLPRDVVEEWWGAREVRGCLTGVLDHVRVGS